MTCGARAITSLSQARPTPARGERPTSAASSTLGDQPGRFAQGPEEKHGLAGRRVGFIKLFLAKKRHGPEATSRGDTYGRALAASMRRQRQFPVLPDQIAAKAVMRLLAH